MVNHPEILWAQRSSEHEPEKNIVFLTISVPELDPSYTLTLTPGHITFSGHTTLPPTTATASKVEPKTYEFDLDLFAEVEEVKRTLTGKNLSLVLRKQEAGEDYWPRLTKEKVKLNFVKTDFGKWKDQDEQEEEEEAAPEEPQGPPGGGMGGMPGMGGMGGMGGAGGMDFAKMMQGMGGGGGEGGAGGMDFEAMMAQMKASGMGGMGGEGGDEGPEEEDDDNDGPPPLEEA